MAPNWKKCRKCGEEFLVLVDGLCAGCSGWSKASSVDPGEPGAIVEDIDEPQDFKSRAAGENEEER